MVDQHWYHEANPLLERVPHHKTIESIAQALAYDQLSGIDVQALTSLERDELLVCKRAQLLPTLSSLKTAMSILGMRNSSYRIRNPVLASGRRLVSLAIDHAKQGSLLVNPPVEGAAVLVVKGIAGLSKSVTINRSLQLLGPQVIEHGAVEAALWKRAVQLNHLLVPMSHDGSRGGLLTGILLAVDAALKTTYSIEIPRKYRTVEKQVGAVIGLLHALYLGVLVIDEIQRMNLVLSKQAGEMQLLLLNLINSGLPVVLVGNPCGFTWLSNLSQEASRMAEREQIYFHPCGAIDSVDGDEWETVFKGVSSYYVLAEDAADLPRCAEVLKRVSGGIPRMALAMWCHAQRSALHDGRSTIGAKDIESVFLGETYDDVRDLCLGFAERDPIRLMRWAEQDVPVAYYAREWGLSPRDEPDEQSGGASNRPNEASAPLAEVKARRIRGCAKSQFKAKETRAQRQEDERKRLKQTLEEEDMRLNGLKSHALASLSDLMKRTERQKQR